MTTRKESIMEEESEAKVGRYRVEVVGNKKKVERRARA